MGECKLATLQRLFEPPPPASSLTPPAASAARRRRKEGGEAFLCTLFEVLCVHC